MSIKEMEAMDEQVMSVVNGHAAPEAVANADEIAEREAARQMSEEMPNGPGPAEQVTAPQAKPNAAPEKERTDKAVYQLREKEFAKLVAEVEAEKRRKTLTVVILCAALAAALLAVLIEPSLLIWLVNIGVASCAVVAGIAIDRWLCHRKGRHCR